MPQYIEEPQPYPGSAYDAKLESINIIPDDKSIANVFCFGAFANKISGVVYNDLTGNFPFMLIDGKVCFYVLYHYELNAILVKAIANCDNHSIYEAYNEVFELIEAKGYKPQMNVMDNQATKFIKKFLTKKGILTCRWWNHTITVSMLQSKQYKHSKMHLWRPWRQPITASHSNCGTNWHCKSRTH